MASIPQAKQPRNPLEHRVDELTNRVELLEQAVALLLALQPFPNPGAAKRTSEQSELIRLREAFLLYRHW